MGMYTEVLVNVDLIENTPEDVIGVLKQMCGQEAGKDYLEGKPHRWGCLFNSGSYYTPNTSCANLTFDKITNQWSLLGKGDIKNYNSEIEKFFEFIQPWCENEFIGFFRYEEEREPNLVYNDTKFNYL